jgi:fumarate reductase subunit D
MKRSNEPIFWSLFGGGGMLSALVGPVLILVTGILVPLGLLLPKDTMSYARMLALSQNPIGKLAVLVVISLFMYHGCHRMLHSLHDLGIHTGTGAKVAFYGAATLATLVAAGLLLAIGF